MATAECKRPRQLKTLKSEDLFGGMIFAYFGQLSVLVLSALPVVLSALLAFLSVSIPWRLVSLRQNYTQPKQIMPKLHTAKIDYAKITNS